MPRRKLQVKIAFDPDHRAKGAAVNGFDSFIGVA
jgi:hypothetical protein